MPKEKEVIKIIPKIYKWKTENLGLFFFVRGQLQLVPTMTIDLAIRNFMRFTGISPDEWDIDSARATYTMLQKEFFNENSNKNKADCSPERKAT